MQRNAGGVKSLLVAFRVLGFEGDFLLLLFFRAEGVEQHHRLFGGFLIAEQQECGALRADAIGGDFASFCRLLAAGEIMQGLLIVNGIQHAVRLLA